jgi:hypothetical protein
MADEISPLTFPVVLKEDTCASCGIKFAVPEYYEQQRRKDHNTFYCPNGHHLHYPKYSDQDTINQLKADIDGLKKILKLIADTEVNAIFNKGTLETVVELAKGALK